MTGPPDIATALRDEEARLAAILEHLDPSGWSTPSLAEGWTVCDVVLHLAQTEEAAAATITQPVAGRNRASEPRDVDAWAEDRVQAERAEPAVVLDRWRRAAEAFLDGLAQTDPTVLVQWVGGSLRPTTLATTRLAEHWAHGLDIAGGLDAPFPDTDRLRHIAWLGHRTLPYAFALEGLPTAPVACELVAPSGATWSFGPPDAASSIRGLASAFCRVGARRLPAAQSGLETTGPDGATALRLLRNYAA